MSNRRSHLVRQSAPYMVSSLVSGNLIVAPDWSQYPPYNDEDGGGPGFATRMALASDVELFLNGGGFHEQSCNHPDFDWSEVRPRGRQELEHEVEDLRSLLRRIDKCVAEYHLLGDCSLPRSFQDRIDRALGYVEE